MPSTVTCSSERATGQRSTAVARIPMVPVTRWISARCAWTSVASVNTWRTCPGLPFFMMTGLTQASSAPAPRAAATARPSCSPVTSSRFVSSSNGTLPASDRLLRRTATDDDLGAVRQVLHFAGAAAETRRRDRHVRQRPEPARQRGQQRGAGRGGELNGDVATVGGDALEQANGRRCGVRQPTVCASDHARPRGDGRGADFVDAQHLEGGGRADDVDDGVVPTNLVEVHLVDRATVQGGFHQCQLLEDGLGARRDPCGKALRLR